MSRFCAALFTIMHIGFVGQARAGNTATVKKYSINVIKECQTNQHHNTLCSRNRIYAERIRDTSTGQRLSEPKHASSDSFWNSQNNTMNRFCAEQHRDEPLLCGTIYNNAHRLRRPGSCRIHCDRQEILHQCDNYKNPKLISITRNRAYAESIRDASTVQRISEPKHASSDSFGSRLCRLHQGPCAHK